MHGQESIGGIVYTGRKDRLKFIAVNKNQNPNNHIDDIKFRLPMETKKDEEDDYHALERGLMEELNIQSVLKISKKPIHTYEYPLPSHMIRNADYYKVKIYFVKINQNTIDNIRVNHRELEGYSLLPIRLYKKLHWEDEQKAVKSFCKLKNIDPYADI